MVRELGKYIALSLVALVLFLVQQHELYRRERVMDLLEELSRFADEAAAFVGAALILVVLVVVIRRIGESRRRERVYKRVASGSTVMLLPRADWKPIDFKQVKIWGRAIDALPPDEHLSFEICGNGDSAAFYLHGSREGVAAALTHFKIEWPGLFYRPSNGEMDPFLSKDRKVWWIELRPHSYRMVRANTVDPLRAIFSEIGMTPSTDGLAGVQIIIKRGSGKIARELRQQAIAMHDIQTQSRGAKAMASREARELADRAMAHFLDVTVRVVGIGKTLDVARQIAGRLATSLRTSFESTNPLIVVRQGQDSDVVGMRRPGASYVWSSDDLAALGHLGGHDLLETFPNLQVAPARFLPADPAMRFDPAKHRIAPVRVKDQGKKQ